MAGSIPLSQYSSNVRGLIGDNSFDITLVHQAINWFLLEIHNNSRIRYMETNDQVYVSSLDTTADFPDDMSTLININLLSPQLYSLNKSYMEYEVFTRRFPGYTSYTPTQILQWTDFGNAMRFAAPVKADSVIDVDYLKKTAIMIQDADTTDIPDVYEELVSKGSLARLMEINEDYQEASQERNNLSPLLTSFIRNEGRGGIKVGPTRMNSNRRGRRGPWSSDVDFGVGDGR